MCCDLIVFVSKILYPTCKVLLCELVYKLKSHANSGAISVYGRTYLHKLGSILLALKVSRNPLVHLCPSVKSSSLHGISALKLGSKDEMFMGLLEQYHSDEPMNLWSSSVMLTKCSMCASLKCPSRH